MEVRFEPDALSELARAKEWYVAQSPRAAEDFSEEFRRALQRMRESPLRWPSYQHGTRRVLLRRFPFAILYRIGMDELQVLAVTHLRRRPGYWRNRTEQ